MLLCILTVYIHIIGILATVCKTVRPMLSDRCLSLCPVLSCMSVCPHPAIFGPCLLWPNGWMDQDATWRKAGLGPRDIVLDGDPAAPPPTKREMGTAAPSFRPTLLWHGRPSQLLLSTCFVLCLLLAFVCIGLFLCTMYCHVCQLSFVPLTF